MKHLWNLLRRILKLGRPRVVTTDTGAEVVMKGLSPELADKVSALLKGEQMSEAKAATEVAAAPAAGTLGSTAVGSFRDADGTWKVAVLKFNPITNQAAIDKIVNCGYDRAEASERFKILAVENNIV